MNEELNKKINDFISTYDIDIYKVNSNDMYFYNMIIEIYQLGIRTGINLMKKSLREK